MKQKTELGNNTPIFHYTRIRNDKGTSILESIIREDAIHMHSAFYRKYAKEDYQWIRKYSQSIVKNLCEKNDWDYNEEDLMLNPYFISFCIDPDSEYMWERYADNGLGMKLIFDKELLKRVEHGNPDGHGNISSAIETQLPCLYIDDKDDLEHVLITNMSRPELDGWDEFNKLKFLVSSVKQIKPYKEEQEYRHIHLHNIVGHFYYNENNPYYEDDNGPIDVNDMWIDMLFPPEMLLGIELGPNTTESDLQYVRQHIINMGYDPQKIKVKPYRK